MAIVVECSCGKRFAARDDLAGKTLGCPACGASLTVSGGEPAPATPKPAAAALGIVVTCDCGSRFAARADLAGKTLGCPKCGASLTVPSPASAPAPRAAPPKSAPAPARAPASKAPAPKAPAPADIGPAAGLGDLLDEVGLKTTKTGARCQKCRADMKPGTMLCVQCGYNHETGEQTPTKRWT